MGRYGRGARSSIVDTAKTSVIAAQHTAIIVMEAVLIGRKRGESAPATEVCSAAAVCQTRPSDKLHTGSYRVVLLRRGSPAGACEH